MDRNAQVGIPTLLRTLSFGCKDVSLEIVARLIDNMCNVRKELQPTKEQN
jgi:hypothetical protein